MFFVREVKRGRGVAVLSQDKAEVSRGVGGGGECRKMARKWLGKMHVKFEVCSFNRFGAISILHPKTYGFMRSWPRPFLKFFKETCLD